jgi:primosomal protein N' (replication factor Y)
VVPLSYGGQTESLTYSCDTDLPDGSLVEVTIGRRPAVGVVVGSVSKPSFKTKPLSPLTDIPPLPADLMRLARWMAGYYASTLSSVFATILPTGVAKSRRTTKPPAKKTAKGLPEHPLTAEQRAALAEISVSTKLTHLLQGVTGSGKTRIYLELAATMLAQNKSVIVLVPEITLTPQIVGQFEEAFGPVVLSSHSKLTEAVRHRIWTEAVTARAEGAPRIVIGPRSALFMPVHDLGLIVIDECHETSYKQEQQPRYHAAPVAAAHAKFTNAKVVLGSATPGLGELYLTQIGRIDHEKLTKRTNDLSLSEAKIIDMRDKEIFKSSKYIAQEILDALTANVEEGRQGLLYLNRRGSASSQVCGDCGHVTTCPNCQLPLTFHADLMRLICHHCNYRCPSPAVCPECNSANLKFLGTGTKRIEEEIGRLLPHARIARLDRDSATLANITKVYRGLRSGELDIVIGTQMIAKGLDMPAIDTVGVINADTMLHLPDYTAAERTYQLLSQVSGRAGRGDRPGRVYIQTYSPDHIAIQCAARNDFDTFAAAELAQRSLLSYPPFVYLLKLTVAAKTADLARQEALRFAQLIGREPHLAVTGPAPAFIEQQGAFYRWILTVKSKDRAPLVALAANLPGRHWTPDLDPINLL